MSPFHPPLFLSSSFAMAAIIFRHDVYFSFRHAFVDRRITATPIFSFWL